MSIGKTTRVTDGPYANWGSDDEVGQIVLTNGSTLKLGQPLCVDVTQLGPDQNVPNNAALLPQCERLVATNNANAGPLFGVLTGITVGLPSKVTLSTVQGVPTWTNSSGASVTLTVQVRQLGWAYVFCGTPGGLTTASAGRAIKIGDPLVASTSQVFGVSGNTALSGATPLGQTIGTALGTAIKTTQGGIPSGSGQVVTQGLGGGVTAAGVISITPLSLVGIQLNTILLIDSLGSGVQEAVSVGGISYPTFSVAVANTHSANFPITGPGTNAAISTTLISIAGAGATTGLVAAYVNCQA